MLKARTFGTMLAFGALAALPACSMFGGGSDSSDQYRQSSYSSSQSQMAQQTAQPGTNMTREAAITPHMIRDVQRKLKEANMYSGRVDGVWGPMTQNGLRQWQQQHNVNATGQLDMATLQAMNISTDNNDQYSQGSGNTPNNGQSNNANNGTNQPNYSTAGNHPNGSNYTSNNNNTPNTSQATQPNATPPASNPAASGGAGNAGSGQAGH